MAEVKCTAVHPITWLQKKSETDNHYLLALLGKDVYNSLYIEFEDEIDDNPRIANWKLAGLIYEKYKEQYEEMKFAKITIDKIHTDFLRDNPNSKVLEEFPLTVKKYFIKKMIENPNYVGETLIKLGYSNEEEIFTVKHTYKVVTEVWNRISNLAKSTDNKSASEFLVYCHDQWVNDKNAFYQN